jgi:hypothetical protein
MVATPGPCEGTDHLWQPFVTGSPAPEAIPCLGWTCELCGTQLIFDMSAAA